MNERSKQYKKEPVNIMAGTFNEAQYIAKKKGLTAGEWKYLFHYSNLFGFLPREVVVWAFGQYEHTRNYFDLREYISAHGFKIKRQYE